MPRKRWAQRCRARSSRTRKPCRAWAVRGAFVCVTHGGALKVTKRKALRDLQMAAAEKALKQACEKHERQLVAWQARRIAATSRLLGIPVQDVTREHIWWCNAVHGEPSVEPPKITDVPVDGRTRRSLRALGMESGGGPG